MNILGPTPLKRLNEAVGIVWLFGAIFTTLALISYYPQDPSWNTATADVQARNLVGSMGAHFADFAFQAFGLAAFAIPAFLLGLAWNWIRSNEIETQWAKVIGVVIFWLSVSALCGLGPDWRLFEDSIAPGGLVGGLLAQLPWALWQLKPEPLRVRVAAVTLGLCLFTNAWTMLSIPSRTYYYNGGLVADNFGQQGERQFMEDVRHFRAAADAILVRGPGVILADHILGTFTRMPLVVNSTGYPPEIVAHLARTYNIRYVVIDHAYADRYAVLQPVPVWSDDKLVVLEVPAR